MKKLILIGTDGHTASLFPGLIPEAEAHSPVIATVGQYEDRHPQRISLTPLVFNEKSLPGRSVIAGLAAAFAGVSAGYSANLLLSAVDVNLGQLTIEAAGTIDPDYRGELRIIMQNLGPQAVTLMRGERIAQLIFARFEAPEVLEVDELSETERSEGGFGSTGTS